jgi:hypothetical protein
MIVVLGSSWLKQNTNSVPERPAEETKQVKQTYRRINRHTNQQKHTNRDKKTQTNKHINKQRIKETNT